MGARIPRHPAYVDYSTSTRCDHCGFNYTFGEPLYAARAAYEHHSLILDDQATVLAYRDEIKEKPAVVLFVRPKPDQIIANATRWTVRLEPDVAALLASRLWNAAADRPELDLF